MTNKRPFLYSEFVKEKLIKRGKMFKKIHNPDSGRSMLEMLGVLAIIGMMIAVAVWGIKLSLDKNKANRLLADVGLGIQELGEKTEAEGKIGLHFTQESSYEISGVMIETAEGRADFVKAKEVEKSVCKILNQMRGDKLYIYELEEEGKGLKKKATCEEINEMYFAYSDYGQEVGGCYPSFVREQYALCRFV